jgi:hypothetical protein
MKNDIDEFDILFDNSKLPMIIGQAKTISKEEAFNSSKKCTKM